MYAEVLRLKSLTGAIVLGVSGVKAEVVVSKHKEEGTEIVDEAIRIIHE